MKKDRDIIDISLTTQKADDLEQVLRLYFKPLKENHLSEHIYLTYGNIFSVRELYKTGGFYTALVCLLTSYYNEPSLTLKIDSFIQSIKPIKSKNLQEIMDDIDGIVDQMEKLLSAA
ncbi:hypothetical protein [Vallitalea okinawensis]|uniref:hypothetical protein n=1 Tax=Vallitalea okinawensis TaxID=2078660 RepID=UPI000CFBCBF0|nr:hypothetical protein [Vallitalea okinawensis]